MFTHIVTAIAFIVVALSLSVGCATADKRHMRSAPEGSNAALSEGYALFYTLLSKNQRVNQIFILKSGSESFKSIINDIASTCESAAAAVKGFTEDDPTVSIEGANLPRLEAETRAALESVASGELLGSSGDDLQKRLVVEQLKATRYAAGLAEVIADAETSDPRSEFFDTLAERFDELHDRLLTFINAAPVDAEASRSAEH